MGQRWERSCLRGAEGQLGQGGIRGRGRHLGRVLVARGVIGNAGLACGELGLGLREGGLLLNRLGSWRHGLLLLLLLRCF